MSSLTYMPSPPVCRPVVFCFLLVSLLYRLNPSILNFASSCDFNHVYDKPTNRQFLLHIVSLTNDTLPGIACGQSPWIFTNALISAGSGPR